MKKGRTWCDTEPGLSIIFNMFFFLYESNLCNVGFLSRSSCLSVGNTLFSTLVIRHSAVHEVFLHKLAHRSQSTACFHRAADEMKVGSCVNREAYWIYLRMVGLVGDYFCRSLSSSRSHWVQTCCQLVFASGNVPFKAKQAMGFMRKPSLIAKAPLGLSAFMNMKSIKLGTIFTWLFGHWKSWSFCWCKAAIITSPSPVSLD